MAVARFGLERVVYFLCQNSMKEVNHFNSATNAQWPLKWINSRSTVSKHCTERIPLQSLVRTQFFSFLTVAPGSNDIRRRSEQSSVTIPYERSFRRIGSQFQPSNADDLAQFQFCGCGWPSHMLVPKGSPEGSRFDVFVMISNYEDDRVDQDSNLYVSNAPEFHLSKTQFLMMHFFIYLSSGAPCNDSYSFCGLRDQKFPDKRAMGYPFDRNSQITPDQNVGTLSEFTQGLPNAHLGEVTIRFTNTVINRST